MKAKYLLLVAAGLVSTPAFAQDFEGFRVEARVGLDRVGTEVDDFGEDDDLVRETGHEQDTSYGGEIGYDTAESGPLHIGIYAGMDFSQVERCDEAFGADEACVRFNRNFYGGIRPGFQLAPSVLLYGKAGISVARIRATYDFDLTDTDLDFNERSSRTGYHLGIGGEFALAANAYVKAEFVHTRYNSFEDEDLAMETEFTRNQVTAGIGLRF